MALQPHQIVVFDEPIKNKIRKQMDPELHENIFWIIASSTSSGKTFVITNYSIPFCVESDLNVIFTSPNIASLEEVHRSLEDQFAQDCGVTVELYKEFSGEQAFDSRPKNTVRVIVAHPTFLSMQEDTIGPWAAKNSLVVFSDEGHKGFMCSNKEETEEAYGYHIADYEGKWYDSFDRIPTVAWFLLTATPLATTKDKGRFRILSEYFDRNELGKYQASVKKIVLYGSSPVSEDTLKKYSIERESEDLDSCLDGLYRRWAAEDERVRVLSEKYDLPLAKPSRVIQASTGDSIERRYHKAPTENKCLAISRKKDIKGFRLEAYKEYFDLPKNQFRPSSQDVISYFNSLDNPVNHMFMVNVISEAVNISNLTALVSFKERATVQDTSVTFSVIQLLGRMLRWPKTEMKELNSWPALICFAEEKIADGADAGEIYEWIDLVFGYELHIVSSPVNVNGIVDFFNKYSFSIPEWKGFKEKLKVDTLPDRATLGV